MGEEKGYKTFSYNPESHLDRRTQLFVCIAEVLLQGFKGIAIPVNEEGGNVYFDVFSNEYRIPSLHIDVAQYTYAAYRQRDVQAVHILRTRKMDDNLLFVGIYRNGFFEYNVGVEEVFAQEAIANKVFEDAKKVKIEPQKEITPAVTSGRQLLQVIAHERIAGVKPD